MSIDLEALERYNSYMRKFEPEKIDEFPVLSSQQVRQLDRFAIEQLGVPGVVLMENAGRGAAEVILGWIAEHGCSTVCIFCGAGNNGGDGFVIARHLHNAGQNVIVKICAERSSVKGDALVNLEIIEKMDLPILYPDLSGDIAAGLSKVGGKCDMIVDALFGTGLKGALRSPYDEVVRFINERHIPVVAVDIPSGLDCDMGDAQGQAIRAEMTVTFAAIKKGFVNKSARRYTGDIYLADIGVVPGRMGM